MLFRLFVLLPLKNSLQSAGSKFNLLMLPVEIVLGGPLSYRLPPQQPANSRSSKAAMLLTRTI